MKCVVQVHIYHTFGDLIHSNNLLSCSMGYFRNPQMFLRVLGNVLNTSSHRFILLSGGFEPLDTAIGILAQTPPSASDQMQRSEIQISLFDGRLFCFSGFVPAENFSIYYIRYPWVESDMSWSQ